MSTISYNDYEKMLFSYNFVGDTDGLASTLGIPNDQPVRQDGDKQVITYSFLRSDNDAINTAYYGTAVAQGFVDANDYQQNIEDTYKNIIDENTSR